MRHSGTVPGLTTTVGLAMINVQFTILQTDLNIMGPHHRCLHSIRCVFCHFCIISEVKLRRTISSTAVPLLDPYNAYWLPLDPEVTTSKRLTSTPSFSAFMNSESSKLNIGLGYEMCTATMHPSLVVPNLFPNSVISHPSATKADSSASTQHAQTTHIIVISVMAPIFGFTIPLLCFITIRRYCKKRREAATTNQRPNMVTLDTQLYFDQKAELEDEARRKHELDAEGTIPEMEGQDGIFELPTEGGDMGTTLASSQDVHEMGGAEHSTELDVP